MRKNRTAKVGIVAVILLLTIAFAAITTNLTISGKASVKANKTDFEENVQFSNEEDTKPYLMINGEETEITPTVAADGKSISFEVPAFDSKGNYAKLYYKIVNNSGNYNAELGALSCKINNEEKMKNDYIEIIPAGGFVGKELAAGETTEDYDVVTLEMIRSYADENSTEYKIDCTITATAVETAVES